MGGSRCTWREPPHTQETSVQTPHRKTPGDNHCTTLTKHCNNIMRKNGELLGWEDQRMEEVGEIPVKMCQFSLLTDKLSLTLLRRALRGLGLASWHLAGTASGKETLPVVALKQQQLLLGRASMEPTLWLLHRAQFATDSHWSDLPATSSSTQLNPAACPSYKLDTRLVSQPGPRRTLIWEQHAILPPR